MFRRQCRRFTTCKIPKSPKKTSSDASQPKKQLGRPGNNLKGGIVGLANVGKSSFFQAITESTLGNPANYPFATIDPEEAKVIVPSKRFENLCKWYSPERMTPATLTVFDIAGLTKGASKGDGLGNAFLSHIRSVDGLFQVVRAFDDPEIISIVGDDGQGDNGGLADPVAELEIINDELLLKDMEYALKYQDLCERGIKRSPVNKQKEFKHELEVATEVLAHLETGKRVSTGEWTDNQIDVINQMSLLTAKPSVYIANVSEDDYMSGGETLRNNRLKDVYAWVEKNTPGSPVVPVSVVMERRLASMDKSDKKEELEILELESAIPEAITQLRNSLQLISFFTCGPKEVREWTIRQGTKAPQAAGVIHRDFEKTFIQAQITKLSDIEEYQGDESLLKQNGRIQAKGKEYVMEDGDVAIFKVCQVTYYYISPLLSSVLTS